MNNKRALGSNGTADPLSVQSVINGKATPAPMGLGLEMRCRSGLYPEIAKSARSVYNQSELITTTPRSFGMPTGSSQDIYSSITGTTGSALQISSSSASDTGAGTGAQTIYIEGLYIDSNEWIERGTFSSPTTLNGQTAVQIGSEVNWYRINKIWVLTAGSNKTNVGDLYISPNGTALTGGVPDTMVLQAVINGNGNSSGGCFSVASGKRFEYTKGNFWLDESKAIIIHEFFFQDFNGSADTDDMLRYEVGRYPSQSVSYDYTGAAPYTEKTDICLTVFTGSGTATEATYYVEYVLVNASKVSL